MSFAAGQIREVRFAGAAAFWVLGIVCLAGACVLLLASGAVGLALFEWAIIGGFAALGTIFLTIGAFAWWNGARPARSVFDSPMLPAACGGVLAGKIRVARPLAYREPIHLILSCILQGGSQAAAIWQNDLLLDQFPSGTQISEIPVYFRIPADEQSSGSGISWRLDVRAKTQGGHYRAAFQIPVIAGPAPRQMLDLPDETVALRSPVEADDGPRDRHVVYRPLPGGGCQVELLPGRNLVMGIVGICFGLVFMGVAAGVALAVPHFTKGRDRAPIWFPICFGSIGLACFLVGARLLLLKTMIIAQEGTLSVETSIGIGRRRWEIPGTNIREITTELQGQSYNRMFYAINLRRVDGSAAKICGTIYDRRDAQWLANKFKEALEISTQPVKAAEVCDS